MSPEDEARFLVERIRAPSRAAARGGGDPLPYARAPADLEEALREAGIPPGLRAARPARRRASPARARWRRRPPAGVRTIALEQGWLPKFPSRLGERELTRQPTSRGSSGSRRSSRAGGADFLADLEAASATGRCGAAACTCSPTTAPRASSSRRSSFRGSRRRSCRRSPEDARRRGRGAAPPLRRPHAGEAPPERHLAGEAEPVPRRARPERRLPRNRRVGDDPFDATLKEWRLKTGAEQRRCPHT